MTKLHSYLIAAGLLLSVAAEAQPGTQAPSQRDSPVVRSMRAYLFREATGVIDHNHEVFTEKHFWNTVGQSSTLLLLTAVDGPPITNASKGAVVVSARLGGRQVLHQKFELRTYFSETGSLTLPLLLHADFCMPLVVDAVIVIGGKQVSAMKADADFRCGE
jgi:hypothetical protein